MFWFCRTWLSKHTHPTNVSKYHGLNSKKGRKFVLLCPRSCFSICYHFFCLQATINEGITFSTQSTLQTCISAPKHFSHEQSQNELIHPTGNKSHSKIQWCQSQCTTVLKKIYCIFKIKPTIYNRIETCVY